MRPGGPCTPCGCRRAPNYAKQAQCPLTVARTAASPDGADRFVDCACFSFASTLVCVCVVLLHGPGLYYRQLQLSRHGHKGRGGRAPGGGIGYVRAWDPGTPESTPSYRPLRNPATLYRPALPPLGAFSIVR